MGAKNRDAKNYDLDFLMQVALNAINVVFLGYLSIYASACPTPTLLGAVAFEFVFYLCLISYRIWRARQPKSKVQVQIDDLHNSCQPLGRLRDAYRVSVIVISTAVSAYLLIDLAALSAARCGNLNLAAAIYRRISLFPAPSIHPGFSMELLAGAYIECRQYAKAEPCFLAAKNLRESLVGERSELAADIYANLGDLYEKEDENSKAESCYLKSIELAEALHLPQGYGSPMTKLAALYTKVRRYSDAEVAVKKALAIRTKLFGANSQKVAETRACYVQLLRAQGRIQESMQLEESIAETPVSSQTQSESTISSTLIPVSISMASLFVFWKRDRMILFAANLVKNARGRI